MHSGRLYLLLIGKKKSFREFVKHFLQARSYQMFKLFYRHLTVHVLGGSLKPPRGGKVNMHCLVFLSSRCHQRISLHNLAASGWQLVLKVTIQKKTTTNTQSRSQGSVHGLRISKLFELHLSFQSDLLDSCHRCGKMLLLIQHFTKNLLQQFSFNLSHLCGRKYLFSL